MINKPFLKICGITRQEDLKLVIDRGVDAVGFIAFPKSPRYISPNDLKALLEGQESNSILKVAVFVNASLEEITEYLDVGIDVVQLHGSESPEFARKVNAPIWRALRLQTDSQISEFKNFPCDKFLIDSFVKDSLIPGGTGHVADWDLAKRFIDEVEKEVLLAGGLKADNLQAAYDKVKPYGFDLSSGVELSPGVKSASKILELIEKLRSLS